MMKKKVLRPGLLTAAAILLFNPFISTLDILPDVLAWLLLLPALLGVAEFVPHFDTAITHLKKLLLITAIKLPSYFIVSAYVAGDERQRVLYTLVCFSLAVVELIWLIPFFRELFAGMDYLAERHGLTALVERPAPHRPSVLARAQRAAYIALPAKLILSVLPELSLLSSYEASGTVTTVGRDLASFRPMLTAIAFLIALGFGIYFLIDFLPLCRMLRKNGQLREQLADARDEALAPLKGIDRIRRVRYAMWCLACGSFFMIDAVFDGINYLPDAIGILLLGAGALLLQPLIGKRAYAGVVAAGVALPFSVAAYAVRGRFFALYSYEALGRIREADALYSLLSTLSVLETVALTALYAVLCTLLFLLIKSETGYEADNASNRSSHLSLHAALRRKAVWMAVLGSLASAATTADVFLRRLTERYKLDAPDGAGEVMSGVILPVYGWFWLVVLALCLAHFAYTLHVAATLNAEVTHKHALS